jgi:ketosteroid isomerase-like protein
MAERACAAMMEDGEEVILVSTTTNLPQAHVGRRLNPWLLVIGLAAALLALGAWVAIDRATRSEPENLASSDVVAMLNDRTAAYQAYDAKAAAAFYAEDAVMEEIDPMVPNGRYVTKGREQILARWQEGVDTFEQYGWRAEFGSEVIQIGRLVAQTHSFGVPGEQPQGQSVVVAELDENGKITHEWVIVSWSQQP